MRKIRLSKQDKYRVLLTDVLPYETPLFFSNEGFYSYCRERLERAPTVMLEILTGFQAGQRNDPRALMTVPYEYDIRKGTLDTRTLSLPHPAIQLQLVSLYERFAHVILHLCSRSRFSLRYPAAVASCIYDRDDTLDEADDARYAATYFKYETCDLLYRFFDSYDFLRLEKRFRHLRTFDISKCFNHIYTHTLSWAVRSKAVAKQNLKSRTFDGDFDAIMQAANYKETAGILIGPEASRVFAEIILQAVDATVEQRLAGRLRHRVDYDVRRYVDDYYVFSRTPADGDTVACAYREELRRYRLYFNAAKSGEFVVPFMTPISCAKMAISDALSTFFDSMVTRRLDGDGKKGGVRFRRVANLETKANHVIQKIKAIVMSYGVEFASLSGFLFGVIERRMRATLDVVAMEDAEDRDLGAFLLVVLDVALFVYAMDVRVASTYKLGRISLNACNAAVGRSAEMNELIKKKIYDEASRVLRFETVANPDLHVETINLLAIIRILGPEYRIPTETIDNLIRTVDQRARARPEGGIDYFLIAAILFHIGDDPSYSSQKAELVRSTLEHFARAEDLWQRSDFLCLFLDLLSCPFLDSPTKEQLARHFKLKGRKLSDAERRTVLIEGQGQMWFTDWLARDNMEVLLEKKRHLTAY